MAGTPEERRARAAEAIDSSLAQAERLFTLSGPGQAQAIANFQHILGNADQLLEARLLREAKLHGGLTARFTGASAMAYQRQVRLLSQFVTQRLAGMTREQALAAMQTGYDSAVSTLGSMEAAYSGISSPLRIGSALVMENALAPTRSSLLQRSATSVDRYGGQMIREFERTVQTGLVMGASQDEMVRALVGKGGPTGLVSMRAVELPDGTVKRLRLEHIPEGLFRRHKFWAERIIRTEVAYAQNAGNHSAMLEARKDFPDLQRKILAMQDDRTAADSKGVHGQIRDLDKPFMDGAGRVYMHPPARPNDREVMIPWRAHYEEDSTTALESPSAIADALIQGAPGHDLSPQKRGALMKGVKKAQAAQAQVEADAIAKAQAAQAAAEAKARFQAAHGALEAWNMPISEPPAGRIGSRSAPMAR